MLPADGEISEDGQFNDEPEGDRVFAAVTYRQYASAFRLVVKRTSERTAQQKGRLSEVNERPGHITG